MVDVNAPNRKYLMPASVETRDSRMKPASIYSAMLVVSRPTYNMTMLLDRAMKPMPTVLKINRP